MFHFHFLIFFFGFILHVKIRSKSICAVTSVLDLVRLMSFKYTDKAYITKQSLNQQLRRWRTSQGIRLVSGRLGVQIPKTLVFKIGSDSSKLSAVGMSMYCLCHYVICFCHDVLCFCHDVMCFYRDMVCLCHDVMCFCRDVMCFLAHLSRRLFAPESLG